MSQTSPKSTIRLLLVDDDQVDRLACKRALAQHPDYDFEIVEAETGNQGLKLLRAQRPDCILLDYHLPDFNGMEFLAELAEENGQLCVPVVMLTGADNAVIAVDALKRGARDYVVKGTDRESLQWLPAVVVRALREQQAVQDKTEAQERLREAEAKYRTLVEQIPAITYIASLESPGKLLYLSPQIGQLGYPAEEWLADPEGLLGRVHEEDRLDAIESYAKTYEHHAPLRCEYRLVQRDGRARWFLDEANVVRDEDGRALFLQGVLVDIAEDKEIEQELTYYRRRLEDLVARRTEQLEKQCAILDAANANLDKALCERRQAEAGLRVSEMRFRLLLESTGEGILGLDTKGRCTFVNRAALALLGYSREELVGREAHAAICQGAANGTPIPVEAWSVRATFRDGVPQRGIEAFRRKDGSCFTAELSAYPKRLDGRLLGAVLVFRDVTESAALTQRLSFQASHDTLTGLINRTEFERRAARVLASAREDQSEHALCYLDLDQFKLINDTCGHAAGDELLRALGASLQSRLRQRDTLARLGGDEFALLIEHCTLDQAWSIAHELCETVRNFRFTWEGTPFSIGVSIGIAALTSADGDVADVIRAADAACYMAKEQGRNRVHVFRPHDDELAERRAQGDWVARLKRALDEDRFRLYCQPVSRLAEEGGRAYHEILLRLVDEDGRLIDPGAFMPAAERHHLMPAIDRWVLRRVVARLGQAQPQAGSGELPIHGVNVSVATLIDDRFVDFVRELLAAHDAPAQALCLEIGESAVLTHFSQVRGAIEQLKGLGCLLAIEDFGSGIAAFTNLKAMPMDFLKIDGRFVRSLAEDPVDRAIAEAINRVAHVMVIETVGQCAESASTLALLRELGVDRAQGYAITAPRPWEQTDELGDTPA
jgi:diguanylate cyclase (GGDEF)-like protein/PAS domain S-box-containing protein